MLVCYWLLIAQIVLESFPISSSSHVKLIESFLVAHGYSLDCSSTIMANDHFAHGPTIAVIVFLFYSRWAILVRHMFRWWRLIWSIVLRVGVADLITCCFYLLFKYYPPSSCMMPFGLCVTAGALLSLLCIKKPRTYAAWDWPRVIMLGVVQGLTLLPGVSRMALTYSAGCWSGLAPRKSFEISLLIQWPLLVAAFATSLRGVSMHNGWAEIMQTDLLLSMFIAALVAWYGLRWVKRCVDSGYIWLFGIYMVLPIMIGAYYCW